MRTRSLLRMALLASCLMSGLTGCLHPAVKVLDPNTAVTRALKGAALVPPCDGYFVPDATMLRIEDRLSEKDVWGTSTNR